MAIATLEDLAAARKYEVRIHKVGGRSTVAGAYTSVFAWPNDAGPSTLTATAAWEIPVSGNTGYAKMPAVQAGEKAYLVDARLSCTAVGRLILFDCMCVRGTTAANVAQTGTTPDLTDRLMGDARPEVWMELATWPATAYPTLSMTYVDLDATSYPVSYATDYLSASPLEGRLLALPTPVAARGFSALTSAQAVTSSTRFYNTRIMRRLWASGNEKNPRGVGLSAHSDFMKTGLTELHPDTALFLANLATNVGTNEIDLVLTIAVA